MKYRLCSLIFLMSLQQLHAQTTNITGPIGSGQFGKITAVLTNGNYVVTDPAYDEAGRTDIGAVYLYDGLTNTLISTLKGSANADQVGSEGITTLPNGNFLVQSQFWDNGSVTDAGAITWVNGSTGINGTVSSSNSLVGSTANDKVGYYFGTRIDVLPNNNYVVRSINWDNGAAVDAGAVTWGDGNTGISGVINSSNSLIGSTSGDQVSFNGLYILTNGNYVVCTPTWDNGVIVNAGAVTWGSAATGISGVIGATNSLVGSTANDNVGNIETSTRILTLTNGNYVVFSPDWDNGAFANVGAVTWCNGNTGLSGAVSTANSLIGQNANDRVGYPQGLPLTNGNYVVCSRQWRYASFFNAGAATWCDGSTGRTGTVNTSNSLVGTKSNDFVGYAGVILTNGNYVVQSPVWGNGTATAVGAATWCDGTVTTSATVSAVNSLVGSTAIDQVGLYITALSNGNYVVSSHGWNNGTAIGAGAVTWGNGSSGTSGVVSAANSLVGNTTGDQVGYFGVTPLSNGNYVIKSPYWDNGAITDVGAATWADGTTSISGTISSANSLTGLSSGDQISRSGITALSNGNYVVGSWVCDNGALVDAGAVTWGDGTSGTSGIVSAGNSIMGNSANENLGNSGVITFAGGGYTVPDRFWDNNASTDAGASFFSDGTSTIAGTFNADNSLVGNFATDGVGQGIVKLTNGLHAIVSSLYNTGGARGAVTLGNSNTGLHGYLNGCNSIFGIISGNNFFNVKYNSTYNAMILGKPQDNRVTILKPTSPDINNHMDAFTLNVNGTTPADFINHNCRIIATAQPTGGATAIKGLTTARAWVDATQNREYVKRHYEIAPSSNFSTATGRVTLYFTDADFNAFNTQSPPPYTLLPLSTDNPALITILKQNLLIERRLGFSNNTATGAPSTYTSGLNQTINPNDADINYNYTLNRWEVTFDVTGFGGFFVKTVPWILPVQWLNVAARLNNQQQAIINWQVEEQSARSYTVEKSIDGVNFHFLATLNSKGDGKNNYTYTDPNTLLQKNFYRIKQTEISGKISYSEMVHVGPESPALFSLYPNPATDWVLVNLYNNNLLNTEVIIYSLEGRRLKSIMLKTTIQQIDLKELAAGIYQLRFIDGTTRRLIKQ